MRSLMKHQKKAFEYAKPLARIALFMEMRLGKTLVAIRWCEYNKLKRVLVVAPLSVLVSWEEELLREDYAYEDIHWLKGSVEEKYQQTTSSKAMWTLLNYESLLEVNPDYDPSLKRGKNSKAKKGGQILGLAWDALILDESTRIRNPQALVTRHVVDHCDHITNRAILSGFPCPESPLDYFEQFKFLYGSFMRCWDYWYFRRKYFRQFGYEWICYKYQKEQIKEEVHKWAFVMTRRQAGIGSKKIYEKRTAEMNDTQKSLIKQIDKGFSYKLGEEEKETKWIPVKYLWYQRIAGGFTPEEKNISNGKLNEILELLRGELKDEPLIIWFRYDAELRYISSELSRKGFKVGIFTGSDRSGDRAFKNADCQILCAQPKCGLYGLDWSRASTAIYYSNWYDGEIRAQSEDRIVHPKKKDPLLYIDLVSEGSIDNDVVEIVREKKLRGKQFQMELARRVVGNVKKKIRKKANNRSRS